MPKRPPIRQVYFVEAEGFGLVKIGVATRAAHRVRNLQIGSPTRLRLRGVVYTDDPHQIERGYHRTWAHLRRHGEWFAINQDLAVFMDEVLWEPDLARPPAAIVFHPAPSKRKHDCAARPSPWCVTASEMVDSCIRQWAKMRYGPVSA